nr:unnamed protein product [Callosobruchus chinensis]
MNDTILGSEVILLLKNSKHGLVNFGLMHAMLHAIVNKLNLQDVSIEFIGKQGEEIQRYINAVGLSDKKGSTIVAKTSKSSVSSGEVSVALTKESFEKLRRDVDKLKKKIGQLTGSSADMAGPMSESHQGQDSLQLLNVQERLDSAEMILKKLVGLVQGLIKATGGDPEVVQQLDDVQKEAATGGMNDTVLKALEKRLVALENAMTLGGAVLTSDGTAGADSAKIGSQVDLAEQLNALQNRLTDMERETAELLEKAHVGGDAGKETGVSDEVATVVASLQEEMTMITENMEKLINDKEKGDHMLDVITEQVELLKTIKADREDLEDALADKADACQINRKVSFEQFDQACGDMSRTMEEALSKLGQQEMLWNQALTDIQNSVGNKLDRMELNPLRDFINNKLRSLQEKFKTLTALKKEQEAAGTKSKYLRNVNCISCDKDVVMRKEMDPTQFPKPYSAQPIRSMGPYLAYDLPNSKNMNMFENALQAAAKASRSPDHICNRYCGGSHTVTTPQQRVTRLGHFLAQWGPELAPVNDTHVRGTDGKMYKARDDEFLKKMAAEKPPAQHAEMSPPIQVTAGGEEAVGGVAKKQDVPAGAEPTKRSTVHLASMTIVSHPVEQPAGPAPVPSSPKGSPKASPKVSVTVPGEEVAKQPKRNSAGSVERSRSSKDMTQSKSQSLPKVPSANLEQITTAEPPAEEPPAEE